MLKSHLVEPPPLERWLHETALSSYNAVRETTGAGDGYPHRGASGSDSSVLWQSWMTVLVAWLMRGGQTSTAGREMSRGMSPLYHGWSLHLVTTLSQCIVLLRDKLVEVYVPDIQQVPTVSGIALKTYAAIITSPLYFFFFKLNCT